jgi:hypothetical protein
MPPQLRHEPGQVVDCTGSYNVVGHYGEPVRIALWFNAGDRLPLVAAADVEPPIWYVLVAVPSELSKAA